MQPAKHSNAPPAVQKKTAPANSPGPFEDLSNLKSFCPFGNPGFIIFWFKGSDAELGHFLVYLI